MFKIKKVAVALSGGVDSTVTLLLLKNKGYNVHAVFMQNWDEADETGICKSNEDYRDALRVCDKLKVPLQRVNFVKQYWNEVFSNLLKEYQSGCTPNPDILCNRYIKFHYLYNYAREFLKADAIATGHYARTSFGPYLEHYKSDQGVRLLGANDVKKDQTLFLSQICQEPLRRTMFPLGEYYKYQVKQMACENGFQDIAQKKESMGICFIGSRDFSNFISEYIVDKPGYFIDVNNGKVVGKHKGLHHWTLGQRAKISGTPIAYFVAKKNVESNNIYVALGTDHPMLYSQMFYTEKPHWINTRPAQLKAGDIWECNFKFQHVENFIGCQVCETIKGLVVTLNTKKRAITSGQFAVFYENNECVGSARIIHLGPSCFTLNWLQNQTKELNEMELEKYTISN